MDPERGRAMGTLARDRVLNDCAWPASYALLDELLERDGAAPRVAGARPGGRSRAIRWRRVEPR